VNISYFRTFPLKYAYEARMASDGASIYIAAVGEGVGWIYYGGNYREINYPALLIETLADVSPQGTFSSPVYYGVDMATNGSGVMIAVSGWGSLRVGNLTYVVTFICISSFYDGTWSDEVVYYDWSLPANVTLVSRPSLHALANGSYALAFGTYVVQNLWWFPGSIHPQVEFPYLLTLNWWSVEYFEMGVGWKRHMTIADGGLKILFPLADNDIIGYPPIPGARPTVVVNGEVHIIYANWSSEDSSEIWVAVPGESPERIYTVRGHVRDLAATTYGRKIYLLWSTNATGTDQLHYALYDGRAWKPYYMITNAHGYVTDFAIWYDESIYVLWSVHPGRDSGTFLGRLYEDGLFDAVQVVDEPSTTADISGHGGFLNLLTAVDGRVKLHTSLFGSDPGEPGPIFNAVRTYVENMPDYAFKRPAFRRVLLNKYNAIERLIERGRYRQAAHVLRNVERHMDGFLGGDLHNDWVVTQDAQNELYVRNALIGTLVSNELIIYSVSYEVAGNDVTFRWKVVWAPQDSAYIVIKTTGLIWSDGITTHTVQSTYDENTGTYIATLKNVAPGEYPFTIYAIQRVCAKIYTREYKDTFTVEEITAHDPWLIIDDDAYAGPNYVEFRWYTTRICHGSDGTTWAKIYLPDGGTIQMEGTYVGQGSGSIQSVSITTTAITYPVYYIYSATITGLTPRTTYQYEIYAENYDSNAYDSHTGTVSTTNTYVKITNIDPEPRSVTITIATNVNYNKINVKLYHYDEEIYTGNFYTKTFTMDGLTPSTLYTVYVTVYYTTENEVRTVSDSAFFMTDPEEVVIDVEETMLVQEAEDKYDSTHRPAYSVVVRASENGVAYIDAVSDGGTTSVDMPISTGYDHTVQLLSNVKVTFDHDLVEDTPQPQLYHYVLYNYDYTITVRVKFYRPEGDLIYTKTYDFSAFSTDTDGDMIWDVEELLYYSKQEYSGFRNAERLSYTDPDSENDGLTDGDEIITYNTDPTTDDTDGDTLTDYDEVNVYDTDPTKWDTDEDGMDDGWEVKYNLDPLVNDAREDPDGDGLINIEEYIYGASPQDEDTDDDTFSDYNEVYIYRTKPGDADTDGDGVNDNIDVNPLMDAYVEVHVYAVRYNKTLADTIASLGSIEYFAVQVGFIYQDGTVVWENDVFWRMSGLLLDGAVMKLTFRGDVKDYYKNSQMDILIQVFAICEEYIGNGEYEYTPVLLDVDPVNGYAEGNILTNLTTTGLTYDGAQLFEWAQGNASYVDYRGGLRLTFHHDTPYEKYSKWWDEKNNFYTYSSGYSSGGDDSLNTSYDTRVWFTIKQDDYDGDDIYYWEEIRYFADPVVADGYDWEGDGMDSSYEIRYGLNPISSKDATQDPDGDGLINRWEYQLGKRNPLDPRNVYRISLTVSLEWNADDAYMMELKKCFENVSYLLLDVTDGYLYLSEVTIYNNKKNWDSANVRIGNQNALGYEDKWWPRAFLNGYWDGIKWEYDTSENRWVYGEIILPSLFEGYSPSEHIYWTMVVHEIIHYVVGINDEYRYYPDGKIISLSKQMPTIMGASYPTKWEWTATGKTYTSTCSELSTPAMYENPEWWETNTMQGKGLEISGWDTFVGNPYLKDKVFFDLNMDGLPDFTVPKDFRPLTGPNEGVVLKWNINPAYVEKDSGGNIIAVVYHAKKYSLIINMPVLINIRFVGWGI